jgi:hypothetical protein
LGIVGLPSDLKLWWNGVIPAVPSLLAGFTAVLRDAPLWQAALIVLGVFVVCFLVSIPGERVFSRWRARRGQDAASDRDTARTTVNIRQAETVNIQQPTTAPTAPPPKSTPSRYRENETIHIADLESEIREGKELVCDWVFKNCRIVGPAVVFVHAPKDPRTFFGCEWAENKDAFTIMQPDDYPDKSRLIGLHLCVFLGCRFTDVEMLVPQRTYERYLRGKVNL